MTTLYADTSVIVRAYLPDEPEHDRWSELLFRGPNPVVTSELTRVEFTTAICAAFRARRVADRDQFIEQFDADCAESGPFGLIRLNASKALPYAHTVASRHRVRALDAIHLAVLATDAAAYAGDDDLALVTRDDDQAQAAREMGIAVLR